MASKQLNWVLWILIFVTFMDLFYFYFVLDQAVYSAMISWQFFPVVNSIFYGLKDHIYPFFTFNFAGGMDTLAESQSSVAHPIKLLIALLSRSPAGIDTLFIIIHVLILTLSSYYYFSRKFCSSQIALFVTLAYSGCLSIYLNFCHPMFIAAMAYHPLILIFHDRIFEKFQLKSWLGLVLSIWLMMLCGHFNLQFIVLLGMMAQLGVGYISASVKPNKEVIGIITAVGFGIWLSAVQLIPTLDLMLATERATSGIVERLTQSVSIFQLLTYVLPGIMSVFSSDNFMQVLTRPNVVEGVHYVGILPFALALSAYAKRPLSRELQIATIILAFMIARALGIFSVLNILLNQLPLFGQFRFPTRNLHIVDFLICLISGFGLFHLKDGTLIFLKILRSLRRVLTFIILSILFLALLTKFGDHSPIKIFITIPSLILLLLPLLAVLATITLFARCKHLKGSQLLLGLVLISVCELSLHRHLSPLYWTSPSIKKLMENGNTIDKKCQSLGIDSVWMHLDWGGSGNVYVWPNFNEPIFPFSARSRNWSENSELINGYRCGLSYSLISSTLTPSVRFGPDTSLRKLQGEELLNAVHIFGFDAIGRWKGSSLNSERLAKQISPELVEFQNLNSISVAPPWDVLPLAGSPATMGLFRSYTTEIFKLFNHWGLKSFLPKKNFHLMPGSTTLPYGPFGYFQIFNSFGDPVGYEGHGAVMHLSGKVTSNIVLYFVPVAFLVGLGVSVLGLIVLMLVVIVYIILSKKISTVQHSRNIVFVFPEKLQKILVAISRSIYSIYFERASLMFLVFSMVFSFHWIARNFWQLLGVAYVVLLTCLGCFYYLVAQVTDGPKTSTRSMTYLIGINSSIGLAVWMYFN